MGEGRAPSEKSATVGAVLGVSGSSSMGSDAVAMDVNRDHTTQTPMASRSSRLELKWRRLRAPFAFFLWPNRMLGLQDSGFIEGKALIREKELVKDSPFPKNTIMSIIARMPTSLRYGLQKASGSHMVFIRYFGVCQLKGWGKAKPRFFVTHVSPRREKEILAECGIARSQWP